MKNFIFITVMLLVGLTYAQNFNSFTYESINGIDDTQILNENQYNDYNADINNGIDDAQILDTNQHNDYNADINNGTVGNDRNINYNSSIGSYNYESLSRINADTEFLKDVKNSKDELHAEVAEKDLEKSRQNIVIRKAQKEVLVRYNGDYSSIKLIDLKGNKIDANFSKKYRGLIVPRGKNSKKYFLEIKNEENKTFYHQVSL